MRLRSAAGTRRPIRPEPRRLDAPHPGRPAQQRPRRLPSRRAFVLGLVAALAGLAVAAALLLTSPRIEAVAERQLTSDATPVMVLRVQRPLGIAERDVVATIAGSAVAAEQVDVSDGGSRISIQAPRLADGSHEVAVTVRRAGLLRMQLQSSWVVQVDTEAPPARVVAPSTTATARSAASAYVTAGAAVITRRPATLVVAAEPGASLSAASSVRSVEAATDRAGRSGRTRLTLDLPDGRQLLTIRAVDAAGNERERRVPVLVDTRGPALVVRTPRVVRDTTLALPISGRDPLGVRLEAQLDGRPVTQSLAAGSTTPPPAAPPTAEGGQAAPDGAADETEEPDEAEEPPPVAGSWRLVLAEPALEGRHVLKVVATDAAGTKTTVSRTFVVDSTEELGAATGLRTGARGADVAQLHEALVEQGMTTGDKLGRELRDKVYGPSTTAAVQAFQKQRGMATDGIAGSDTIAGLTLKIVIDRGAHQLTLYRLGEVVKSYGIAVGSPEYPTPAGSFSIQTKERNPTWTPPDSEWAKDEKVTPPGPDNPLGTRWMAIAGTVGIHGTNSPASIGYSVSHGCIRMKIPDVEELFDMVEIGTPVTVV